MYKILEVEEAVRVSPKEFNEDLEGAIKTEFRNAYLGRTKKELGVILAVTEVSDVAEGKMVMGDGAIYYNAIFEVLVYRPRLHEVVEGSITEITDFGSFVNFGPMDGLIHISQITEDYMSYDEKNTMLVGKETNKIIRPGDKVRARIVAVSLKSKFGESKIGLTMRQPYLGKLEWIEKEKEKKEKEKKEKEKEKKSEKEDEE